MDEIEIQMSFKMHISFILHEKVTFPLHPIHRYYLTNGTVTVKSCTLLNFPKGLVWCWHSQLLQAVRRTRFTYTLRLDGSHSIGFGCFDSVGPKLGSSLADLTGSVNCVLAGTQRCCYPFNIQTKFKTKHRALASLKATPIT